MSPDLPAELIAHIISYLTAVGNNSHDESGRPGDNDNDITALPLSPYATVSRAWQQRVEASTFAHLTLTPARLASPLAAQALTLDRVHRFVRSVRLDVLLPPYDKQARARREDEGDWAVNDGVFTDVVRRLFGLLAAATATAGDQGGQRPAVDAAYRPKIHLFLTARCVSDGEDIEARYHQWNVYGAPDGDLFQARYQGSYLDLRLAAHEALPEVYCIQHFRVQAGTGRHLPHFSNRTFAPRALCLMTSRMQGLEEVHWGLSDNEKRDPALRKTLRTDFAYALHTLPSSLQSFDLVYERHIPLDHSFQTPSLLDETDPDDNDKLSLALHKLSQRLVTFTVIADVGPEILWPSKHGDTPDDAPLWPRLHDYSIVQGPIAPSGK